MFLIISRYCEPHIDGRSDDICYLPAFFRHGISLSELVRRVFWLVPGLTPGWMDRANCSASAASKGWLSQLLCVPFCHCNGSPAGPLGASQWNASRERPTGPVTFHLHAAGPVASCWAKREAILERKFSLPRRAMRTISTSAVKLFKLLRSCPGPGSFPGRY